LQDADVQGTAGFLIRNEMVDDALPVLRRMLKQDTLSACPACLDALTRLRDTKARPLLEARLAGSTHSEQGELLRALLPSSDPTLARQIQGWVELQLLAPTRFGDASISRGAGRETLFSALMIIAVDGGSSGKAFLERLLLSVPKGARRGTREALLVAEALPAGLGELLHHMVFGSAIGEISHSTLGNVSHGKQRKTAQNVERGALEALEAIDPRTFRELRSSIYLLCPRLADSRTPEVLEKILLEAPSPDDRMEAAMALFSLKEESTIPALKRALRDPYFQDGPYPLFRYPVRRLAARALQHMGIQVTRRPDRSYSTHPTESF
jgi:hypothetical protein